ncbi:MXAN_5187 family protein [Vitiosangium sp. GDMCC 1.1324]|uniref:MXAN_5187 family protein n=1 Tax=Vitiosangium sp. (strain GDMCC 1.1324) TaxID=2138576 RepID=UPI000D35D325|nr:MXAN_5187 family protein [Vitiosangium sp. GDMCC 1.1324]PTL78704.1 cell division protein FtsK [Vitiosangium sp. GDMCC 1.1324]
MVRFKFFVFALLVLGLGLAHLPLVSGPLSVRVTEDASAPTRTAISEMARSLESRRLAVQGVALKLAASPNVAIAVQPHVVALPKGKGIRIEEPPTGERFSGLRSAAKELVPEPLKGGLVLGLLTNEGSLYARAEEEPVSDDKLDVQALAKAGSEGVVVDVFDAPHVFYSVPVLWNAEGGHAQVAATLVVGAPLVADKAVESAALASGVAAIALVKGDKVLGTAGSQKELAEAGLKALRAGQIGHVVERGSVRGWLPQVPQVKLPLFTSLEDSKGGQAPLAVGSRRALEGGLEVVAVASVRPFMTALADYQQSALFALMCLLGFSLVWTLVMGSARAPAQAPAAKEEKKKKGKKGQEAEAPAPAPQAAAPLPVAPAQEPPVPGPDDFPFPASPAPTAPPVAAAAEPADFPFPPAPAPSGDAFPFPPPPAPGADPYGSPTVPGKDPFAGQALGGDAFPFPTGDSGMGVATAEARRGAFAFEDQPTAAYSLKQAADPFAAAAAQAGLPPADFGAEAAPETTRVAAIPQELLARSARPNTAEVPLPNRPGHPGVAAPSAASTPVMGTSTQSLGMPPPPSEEQHFQDVFREFVATRDQCGEPNDGLTYDKFVAKLRKNKEQLVQKYACKTVRFQVYVKEGKAALKATPVKD